MDVRSRSVEIRRRVGYLPGEPVLYENLTGEEFLRFLGNLRGGVDRGYVSLLAERLECDLDRPIRTLSRGNRQKLAILQAFIHRPELLIMDEPTSGLDPLMQNEFHRLVRETAGEGTTYFISSHNLPEVEALKRKALRRLEIHFANPVSPRDFRDIPGVRDLRLEDRVLTCTVTGSVDALVKAVARFEVLNVVSPEVGLEEIFLEMYREGGGESGGASHA
jgi:ABC-2 type transport system ATP-binding protein